MVNIHFYLDCRAVSPEDPAPLKLVVCKHRQSAMLATGVKLLRSEWDAYNQRVIVTHRKRVLNSAINALKVSVEDFIRPHIYAGEYADLSAAQIRDEIDVFINGDMDCGITAGEVLRRTVKQKKGGTRTVYESSLATLLRVCPNLDEVPASKVNSKWVMEIVEQLQAEGNAHNYIATVMRCFKAAWNAAKKEGLVGDDPVPGSVIRPAPGAKRDLTIEQLRTLWEYVPDNTEEARALDFFRLSFLLRAINPTDLIRLRDKDYINGRIYYDRAKTGKPYSVKVESEAAMIIDRHRSHGRLFVGFTDYNTPNRHLKAIAGKLNLPPVTMYWARHTLASLLFELGIGVDVVAAVLGHSVGPKVTMTYINIKERQVDEAMRKVIDYLMKKGED